MLYNSLSQNLVTWNNKNLIQCTRIQAQYTGWFWLRISHEIVVKMLAGAAVIWKLDWDRIYFQNGSLVWLLAGGLSFTSMGLFTDSLNALTLWQLALPRMIDRRRRARRKPHCLLRCNLRSHTLSFSLYCVC